MKKKKFHGVIKTAVLLLDTESLSLVFSSFIKYCSDSGGYGGFRPDSIVTEDVEGLVERLACLCVDMRVTGTLSVAAATDVLASLPSDLWNDFVKKFVSVPLQRQQRALFSST